MLSDIDSSLENLCIHATAATLRRAIENGAHIAETDSHGNTAVSLACQSRTVEAGEKLDILLKTNPALANRRNANGLLPIHYAVRRSNLDCLQRLLHHNSSSINERTTGKRLTPLHIAAHFGLKTQVKFLLSFYRLKMNARDRHGDTPERG